MPFCTYTIITFFSIKKMIGVSHSKTLTRISFQNGVGVPLFALKTAVAPWYYVMKRGNHCLQTNDNDITYPYNKSNDSS